MERYKHLRFSREEPVNKKRPPAGFGRQKVVPDDPQAHGLKLRTDLKKTLDEAQTSQIKGFDDRFLIKVETARGFDVEKLEVFPGIEVVSQESDGVILAFANRAGLRDFEARLTTIIYGEHATRQDLIYAMQAFGNWTVEDRKGPALKLEGIPSDDTFILDAELWPVEAAQDRQQLLATFKEWLTENGIESLDVLNRESLVMFRLRVNHNQTKLLFNHRDVRMVDLPPRYGFSRQVFATDINQFPEIISPPTDAPGLVVLDTGVQSNHPLLGPAFGEGRNFFPDGAEHDDVMGHGTHVAGIALYGDVHKCIQEQIFVPTFWLYSGRILDEDGYNTTGFLENQIEEAVDYFLETYGCRVFNLSIGDRRKPYNGGHVRGLALTLDELSRQKDVLFVVSAGNFDGVEEDVERGIAASPQDWHGDYPSYLMSPEAHILDPAPSLNSLTVGSIARWEQSFDSQQYPNDPDFRPIANRGQPSPFTRCGPSINGALKPDLVAFGGNHYVRGAYNAPLKNGLGEISTARSDGGRLFGADCGTSFAAPHISHYATRFLAEFPDASPDLVRAVLVAHARHTAEIATLFQNPKERRKVCGYGQVQESFLFSSQDEVTLMTEDYIENRKHHFYEIPVPSEFYGDGTRVRELTVALAYTPVVRTTRINYKATKLSFKVVEALSLEAVVAAYNAETPDEDYEGIPEFGNQQNRSVSSVERSRGTVQASTWTFKRITEARRNKKLFVVITRLDHPWGNELCAEQERYALAVTLADRNASNASLYTSISQQIAQKVQQRQRADLHTQQRVRHNS